MILRRLVAAAMCCALAAPNNVSALRLRGVKESKLQRRSLQKNTEVYTWSSGDQNVVASVSKGKHDAMMEKIKSSKGTTSADAPDPKEKDSNNRPPEAPKKGSGASKRNSRGKGSSGGTPKASGPSYDGGSVDQPVPKNPDDKKGEPERPPKGIVPKNPDDKTGSPERPPKGSGSSYDGASGDQPKSTKGGKNGKKGKTGKSGKKGGKKGSGASKSSGTDEETIASKESRPEATSEDKDSSSGGNDGSGSTPVTPPRPPLGQDEALTGVAVSRFALLYSIDHAEGMPMTTDYEAVHENTYMWLYTIMFRKYGDQLRNLLTDDTSNIYEANKPVTIEYASVALFAQGDPNVPTQEELDEIVISAFTGTNGETYLDGIQSLPRTNPFRSTSAVELESVIPGNGRSVMGRIADRVSSKGMAAPLIGAAALMVFLAGGAGLYKARQNRNDGGKAGKFDSNTLAGETQTMTDEFTMKTVIVKGLGQGKGELEQTAAPPPASAEARDPDLDGLMEDNSQQLTNEDKSEYSIEDFVNEAERTLLGARIRYPTEGHAKPLNSTNAEQLDVVETSTALVTAPPSAIVPASAVTSRASL